MVFRTVCSLALCMTYHLLTGILVELNEVRDLLVSYDLNSLEDGIME